MTIASDGASTAAEAPPAERTPSSSVERARPYAFYALAVLTSAGVLNYADRNIVSILAESIKADLHLSDQQLGFLYGTAFAVFFAMVGIPMGRLADALSRKRLMATGLTLWSSMTALSGFAGSFAQLAGARLGVGLGEATANPCSHSMISDFFPKRSRATALAVYLVGTTLGTATALGAGGFILQHWPVLCQSLGVDGACGVKSWKVAFFVVGLPGLLIALLVALLREPPQAAPSSEPAAAIVFREFSATLPPLTLLALGREAGVAGVLKNLALAAAIVALATGLGLATHDWPQWIAVGLGTYSIGSWMQILRLRDRPLFALSLGCPTFVLALVGMAVLGCLNGTFHFWAAPHAIRELGMSASTAGSAIGAVTVVGSILSIMGGGLITDWWKLRDPRAPFWMALIALLGQIPAVAVMFLTDDPAIFVGAFFVQVLVCQCWGGGAAALAQDLVLPRMRGTGSACFSLIIIIITLAMGPYWSGKISSLTGSLTLGVLSGLALVPFAVACLVVGAQRMRRETEDARWARARANGEP
jgi:MFS family permease